MKIEDSHGDDFLLIVLIVSSIRKFEPTPTHRHTKGAPFYCAVVVMLYLLNRAM